MDKAQPNVIVLAGPNGAGKSTMSEMLFAEEHGVLHYVNADLIAKGLSAFRSEDMALEAGRVMLDHLR
jgi:predicted ABC-type ATPase